MECIESSQVLVRKEKTGNPSQHRAVRIIGLLPLLISGLAGPLSPMVNRVLACQTLRKDLLILQWTYRDPETAS